MNASKLSRWLFTIFLLMNVAVFAMALVLPGFRSVAYAPLRELLLPPPSPIVVTVLYSTEKEEWLNEAVASFEATRPTYQGHPIQIKLTKMGSREMVLAVLDGNQKPVVLSPASSLQATILQDLSISRDGTALVRAQDPASCRSVLQTPLVLVMWSERAAVLWGENPNGTLWLRLQEAVVNERGWEAYGHPEWGYIKFGHTSPLKSNSGFMTILLMTYNYFGKSSGLTEQDILGNRDYQAWFQSFEGSISSFGDSTGTYMKDIVAYGPSMYDVVAVYEATAIEQAQNAMGRYGELRFYYPPLTVLSDHPFCVLDADWVAPEQAAAANLFIDYLLSRPMQERALLQYGFRPADASIAIDQPGSPFLRYASSGLRLNLPPLAQLPSGNVLNTLLEFWDRTIQR